MPSSPLAPATPQTSSAPDWNNVPFPVACARCGHDVHGQTEPKCPACALEFDWRDACPIEQLKCAKCGYHLYGLRETRCPECGEGFDWRLVLLDHRRRQKDLFEYRWRGQPVRSLLRTGLRTLRPKRFWNHIDMHDPVQWWPLLFFLAAAVVTVLLADAAMNAMGFGLAEYYARPAWIPSGVAPAPLVKILWKWFQFPSEYWSLSVTTYWLTTCAAFLLLPQSMRLYRVRYQHLLRVSVYAVAAGILAGTLFNAIGESVASSFGSKIVNFSSLGGGGIPIFLTRSEWRDFGVPIVLLGTFGFLMWSIGCAYHYYLRIPHAWGIALVSQCVAILATIIVTLAFDMRYAVRWLL